MELNYQLEPELTAAEFVDVLIRSTLGQRRPVGNLDCMKGMLRHADVIVTARNESGLLVGVSRAISDFHYCTYLSDLAVDVAFQKMGIGKQLIAETHQAAGKSTQLILLAAPAATEYYARVGFEQHGSCWIFRDV